MPRDFACPDWLAKLQRGETPIPALALDENLADVAVKLFDKLRVPDISGQPTFGEVGGEWVRDIVRAAFGSIDPETGERWIGEIFNLIPKKNGKTTNAAGLGLVAMQMNTVPNIDGIIVGPTQEVADKCFAQAVGMIEADPWLSKRFRVQEHRKTIIDMYPDPKTGRPLNAKLKIKSFDPKVVTGSIPAFAILDELHVMAAAHYASRVIGQIRGGMITNPQSLLIFITTQSEEAPVGVFKDELDYARKVRDGEITKSVRTLPVLYELPEAVQKSKAQAWRDPKHWPMVLPNLGRSITLDRLVALYDKADSTGTEELARWASQHLNVQIGQGGLNSDWVGASLWADAAIEGLSFAELKKRSEVCVVGIDGGGMDDLMGLTVIGRCKATKRWLVWAKAWAHPIVLERRKSIAEKLRDLAKAGDLTICETKTQDVEQITEICDELQRAGLLPKEKAIGLDPEGVAQIVDALEGIGLADLLVAVSQGYRLNSAIKGTERKLYDGSMKHGGQPLMSWCVGNAKTEPRGNAVMVTKAVSGAGKIDPLMAMFNGVMLMSWNPESHGSIDDFLAAPVMAY